MKLRKMLACLAACVMLTAAGCGSASRNDPNRAVNSGEGVVEDRSGGKNDPQTSPEEETTEEETEAPSGKSGKISFLAVGDNLIHSAVYRTAAEHAENGDAYNFRYCYQYVADKIGAADLAFINQETVICGGEYEISGANLNFCSPDELGDELMDLGFDIINLSNNHILDKGSDGMRACLDYWDTQVDKHPGVIVEGVYRDYQDMFNYRTTEVNGITVGVLGYTDHTNGYSLPSDSEMRIPYTSEEKLIQQQVSELKEQVDCVIVSTHWGVEDTHTVPEESKDLAQKLINWGADVVIGTGPHTLQSMEYLSRPDGSQGFVYYSLGNFISGQTDNFNMVGGMALFDIVMTDGVLTIEEPKLTPVITQYETGGLKDVRVVPYYAYTDEMAANHGIPYSPMGTAKNWGWDVVNRIVENNVPEEYQKLDE
ncbi:MAG: CapA family protein [Oscillospiraceae bacterium]|nr:CapA family protein [Oscillospiraceae bacterium]